MLLWLSSLVGQALAQELSWSFESHPHPDLSELTPQELSLKFVDMPPSQGSVVDCLVHLDKDFEVYNFRYPSFRQTGEVDTRYNAWKRYVADTNNAGVGFCKYAVSGLLLLMERTRFEVEGFRFCGALPKPSGTDAGRRFNTLVSEMLTNAQTGFAYPIEVLFMARQIDTIVSFNPDIEYYLRRFLAEAGEGTPEDWDVSKVLPELDPERIAFVDAAVARKDFGAVVETTAPCSAQ